MNPIVQRVHESTFIDLVAEAGARDALLGLLAGGTAEGRATAALIGFVASRCRARPEQLEEAIGRLAEDPRPEARMLLEELLLHAEVPEHVLLRFVDDARSVRVLGQRRGPRALLDALAERHGEPDAITTLALTHHGADGAPDEAFRAFLEQHREVEMLEVNIRRATHLEPSKLAIVREVFGDGHGPPRARRRSRRY